MATADNIATLVQHGHWGMVHVAGIPILEVASIEYTLTIERIDVNQAGTRWTSFKEGLLSGDGTLRINKVYGDFEYAFLKYATSSVQDLIQLRDQGKPVRADFEIQVFLNDVTGLPGGESETLTGAKFWTYTGGFDVTALTTREWPFSFTGIIRAPAMPRGNSVSLY